MNLDQKRPQIPSPTRSMSGWGWWVIVWALFWHGQPVTGAPIRVLPEGQQPEDRRLESLKDLNGYFPFAVPATLSDWNRRRADLQRRVRVATGLWPMPEKTPLNPVVHGRVEREGFTVDKVYFESLPGHFVTGLLFRPQGMKGLLPAVLSPHGHGGRMQEHGAKMMEGLIAGGQEKFENSGRFPKLARCAQLARMGVVVLIYDMEGYADSGQISYELAHRYAKGRPGFNQHDRWGLYSTQAELRLQSVMGLLAWNSIRALDFLCGLPDVDPARIGVTGGSGGGTQTILLCAIDSRPVVAFPQGMVSTSMQGGCTCENCSLLRIGTGNVELAALFAPKPQGMTAADDWTKEMMTKGYPELKKVYALLGKEDLVKCWSFPEFPHNYNYVTRQLMYEWFHEHLQLKWKGGFEEKDWPPLTPEEYTVWNTDHPKPSGGDEHEFSLTRFMAEQSDLQMAALQPRDEESWEAYREVVGGAMATMIGRGLPMSSQLEEVDLQREERSGYILFRERLRLVDRGEELPTVALYPRNVEWNRGVVLWISGKGKAGLFDQNGELRPEVAEKVNSGMAVVGADLFMQGDFLKESQGKVQNRTVANPREFAGYTFGYNHTLFAQRVHDILTLVSFVRHHERGAEKVNLVAVDGAGPWAAAARAVAGGLIDHAHIETGGFRFADLKSYRDENFLPGAVKYGDLPGMLSLSAPHALSIRGEQGEIPALVKAAYKAAGRSERVQSE